MARKLNFHINKDRSVDIYIGRNSEEVITLDRDFWEKIELQLSKFKLSDIEEEQRAYDHALILETEPNWGPTMHPDYGKEGGESV